MKPYVALLLLVLTIIGTSWACSPSKTLELATYAVKGSEEERVQFDRKILRGCTLDSESIAHFNSYDTRYRTWCCPPKSPKAGLLKRGLLEISNKDSDADDDDEDEEVHEVTTMTELSAFVPLNLDRIDQRYRPIDSKYSPLPMLPIDEQRTIHVYVVDTGVELAHSLFRNVTIDAPYHDPQFANAKDANGHGTMVASIIASAIVGVNNRGPYADSEVTSRITLHAVRVLDARGEGTTTMVVNALIWIQNNALRPAIVSMSLGAPRTPSLNTISSQIAAQDDMIVVTAAGNSNEDACWTSPAGASGVISVGATDPTDRRSTYSNYGLCVDIFAPGDNVWGADAIRLDGIVSGTGTSFACPMVTGAIARKFLESRASVDLKHAWLDVHSNATRNIVAGGGPGSPNTFLYVGRPAVSPTPSPLPPSTPPPSYAVPPTRDRITRSGVFIETPSFSATMLIVVGAWIVLSV